jgi:hypothetical protein
VEVKATEDEEEMAWEIIMICPIAENFAAEETA